MTRSGRAGRTVDWPSWVALIIGSAASIAGDILLVISTGLPPTRNGWIALVLGGILLLGLPAATAVEVAGGSGGRNGRRRWLRRVNRRQFLVLGVIVLVVLTTVSGKQIWQRTQPCGEAIGVPVAAAPSVQPAIRDIARVWMGETRQPGGCPRYAVHLSTATDAQVRRAILHGGSTGLAGGSSGPVPLVWFPEDFRRVDELTVPGNTTAAGAVVVRKQLFAASPLRVVLPPGLVGRGDRAGERTAHHLAAEVAEGRIRLVRSDPRSSALALLASGAMYPAGTTPNGPRRIDAVEEALTTEAAQVRGDGEVSSTVTGSGHGLDSNDVARAMCLGRDPDLAFMVAEHSFRAVKEAPTNEVTGCRPSAGKLMGMPLTTDSGDELRLFRAVAILDPDPGQGPVPSRAATEAARVFVDWLGKTRGQERLRAAGFDSLAWAGPRPAPLERPLDSAQSRRLAEAERQFADSTTRRLTPHDVVVAIDASGSMGAPSGQGSSRYAASAAALAATVGPRQGVNDRIGMVLFGGGEASVAVEPTHRSEAPRKIGTALDDHRPSGGTPLAAGIRAGIGALGDPEEGGAPSRSLLVLTDGGRASDGSRLTGVLDLARAYGVTVRVISVGASCRTLPTPLRAGGVTCTSTSGTGLPVVLGEALEALLVTPVGSSDAGGRRT